MLQLILLMITNNDTDNNNNGNNYYCMCRCRCRCMCPRRGSCMLIMRGPLIIPMIVVLSNKNTDYYYYYYYYYNYNNNNYYYYYNNSNHDIPCPPVRHARAVHDRHEGDDVVGDVLWPLFVPVCFSLLHLFASVFFTNKKQVISSSCLSQLKYCFIVAVLLYAYVYVRLVCLYVKCVLLFKTSNVVLLSLF